MFERYTEKARRTIFFARYEASQFGSAYIETEHLLLGLLREDKALANQFLGSFAKIEAIRHSIAQRGTRGDKIPTSVDLPLSHECKRVLAYGAEEAERMNHKHIGPPHLLLGLLREEKSFAAQLLNEQGLNLKSVREQVHAPMLHASTSIERLRQWLDEREARGGIWAVEQKSVGRTRTDFAIYAGDPPDENDVGQDLTPAEVLDQTQKRIASGEEPPPLVPFLCVELIGDERFFTEVRKRCEDYIAAGVAEVWLLDPNFKRAYTVNKTEGLREFRGEVLQIANPPLEMDLRKIFDQAVD